MASASTDAAAEKKTGPGQKRKSYDLAQDKTYQGMVAAVSRSVKVAATEGSGPHDALMSLKEERRVAKKAATEKPKS